MWGIHSVSRTLKTGYSTWILVMSCTSTWCKSKSWTLTSRTRTSWPRTQCWRKSCWSPLLTFASPLRFDSFFRRICSMLNWSRRRTVNHTMPRLSTSPCSSYQRIVLWASTLIRHTARTTSNPSSSFKSNVMPIYLKRWRNSTNHDRSSFSRTWRTRSSMGRRVVLPSQQLSLNGPPLRCLRRY